MKYLLIAVGLSMAAVVATLVRYESLDPCVWLVHDAADQSGLPMLAEEARIRTEFLVRGITEPGAGECLGSWWRLRFEGANAGK